MESYKHKFAKDVLAGWFNAGCFRRNKQDAVPLHAIKEYPVALTEENLLTGLIQWDPVPTYDTLLDRGLLPLVIFDVAITNGDVLLRGLEVAHSHPLTDVKRAYIARIISQIPWFAVAVIDADWVLAQDGAPKRLQAIETIGTWAC